MNQYTHPYNNLPSPPATFADLAAVKIYLDILYKELIRQIDTWDNINNIIEERDKEIKVNDYKTKKL